MERQETSAEWCRRMILEWEWNLESATQEGDYRACQIAERELENYRQLLKQTLREAAETPAGGNTTG